MAINTKLTGARGAEATYCRIAAFKADFIQNNTEVALYAYSDKDERDAYPTEPISYKTLTIGTANVFDKVLETREEIYEELTTATVKTQNEKGEIVETAKYPDFFEGKEI